MGLDWCLLQVNCGASCVSTMNTVSEVAGASLSCIHSCIKLCQRRVTQPVQHVSG